MIGTPVGAAPEPGRRERAMPAASYRACPVIPPPDEDGIEANYRNWNETGSWEGGSVPEEGDDVVIKAGWNMLLNIADPPKFNSVTILVNRTSAANSNG